ncbi:putative 26S proteasome regulatory subunit p27 [Spathaspora sp. JA1]|nr:putative 26S proteasome regulatory subunit p27 [Spathaspora sp. JA1]
MTIDDQDSAGSFKGLMRSLNLDNDKFKEYDSSTFATLNFSQLSALKTDIESQLGLLFDLLKQKYNAEMTTKLVTPDGFPRSDIDVVSIRLIRVRIIRLRNDHKRVLQLVEEKMVEEFESRKDLVVETTSTGSSDVHSDQVTYTIPFAEVRGLVANGPAAKSGLKEHDQIIVFDGDIHAANNRNLSALVTRVRDKIEQEINVVVKRDGERLTIRLKPTNSWEGQGLLGCRLVPI